MPPSLIQLAYVSSSAGLLTLDEIAAILIKSREKNAALGITGMLLYRGGNILQVIEGEDEKVLKLFEIIKMDERHRGVIQLYKKSITERDFPDWQMGFHDLDAEAATHLEGFVDVFGTDFDLHALKASQAAKLIDSFKKSIR